jgi:hypothetical protein
MLYRMLMATMLIVLVACDTTSTVVGGSSAPTVTAQPVLPRTLERLKLPAVTRRRTSVAEDSLIALYVAQYPPQARDEVRELLLDPRVTVTRAGVHAAQPILDAITALRRVRSDSIRAAAALTAAEYPIRPAMVAEVDRLSDTTATAIIIRRVKLLPHDVIELQSDRMTVHTLGAAVHALASARARGGDDPVNDEIVVVHGGDMPASWKTNGLVPISENQLQTLQASQPASLPGVGNVRSMRIMVSRHAVPGSNR